LLANLVDHSSDIGGNIVGKIVSRTSGLSFSRARLVIGLYPDALEGANLGFAGSPRQIRSGK
jgi:hypothetical protein